MFRWRWLWFFLWLLILTGCQNGGVNPPPTPDQAVSPRPAPRSEVSSTPIHVQPSPPTMPCHLVTRPAATLDPASYLLPEDHVRGDRDAAVVLLVYADFQCPGCAVLARALQKLQTEFGDQVTVVYRHFPLAEDNDKALLAVQAAEAAAQQSEEAFWALHDFLYAHRAEWIDLSPEEFRAWLLASAPELGLDPDRLAQGLDDPALARRAQAAWEQGRAAGLDRVPLVFINGELYTGPPTYEALRAVVALHVLAAKQFHQCPPWVIDPAARYRLTLHTSRGSIVILLDPRDAPQAVNSLVFLAQQGWYDGSPAYRIDPGQAVYLGDPSGTGYGHAGYFFTVELTPNMRYDTAGLVGLVNDGPDTNSSRFFISLAPLPSLNGRATRVGRVVQGLDVLKDLPAWDGLRREGLAPLVIQKVQVQVVDEK